MTDAGDAAPGSFRLEGEAVIVVDAAGGEQRLGAQDLSVTAVASPRFQMRIAGQTSIFRADSPAAFMFEFLTALHELKAAARPPDDAASIPPQPSDPERGSGGHGLGGPDAGDDLHSPSPLVASTEDAVPLALLEEPAEVVIDVRRESDQAADTAPPSDPATSDNGFGEGEMPGPGQAVAGPPATPDDVTLSQAPAVGPSDLAAQSVIPDDHQAQGFESITEYIAQRAAATQVEETPPPAATGNTAAERPLDSPVPPATESGDAQSSASDAPVVEPAAKPDSRYQPRDPWDTITPQLAELQRAESPAQSDTAVGAGSAVSGNAGRVLHRQRGLSERVREARAGSVDDAAASSSTSDLRRVIPEAPAASRWLDNLRSWLGRPETEPTAPQPQECAHEWEARPDSAGSVTRFCIRCKEISFEGPADAAPAPQTTTATRSPARSELLRRAATRRRDFRPPVGG